MKFLIFNIIVFFALGYILTSQPNENFKSWISNKKNQISKLSKEDYTEKLKAAIKIDKSKSNVVSTDVNKEKVDKLLQKKFLSDVKQITNDAKKQAKNNIRENSKILSEAIIQDTINDSKKIYKKADDKNVSNKLISDEKQKKFQTALIDNKVKIKTENKFLSPEQRSQALSEIITDLEIFSIKGLLN